MSIYEKSLIRLNTIRALSLVVIVSFAVQELSWAGAGPQPAAVRTSAPVALDSLALDPALLPIPAGKMIRREHRGGTNGRVILHIQDAHANYTAQKNIASSLAFWMDRFPEIGLVAVEGGSGDGSLERFREAVPSGVLKRAAAQLLRDGWVTGEEYLNLTSDRPMRIWGVEDEDLYDRNRRVYARVAALRSRLKPVLHRLRSAVEALKARRYPQPLLDYEAALRDGASGAWEYTAQAEAMAAHLSDHVRSVAGEHPSWDLWQELRADEARSDLTRLRLEADRLTATLSADHPALEALRSAPASDPASVLEAWKQIIAAAEAASEGVVQPGPELRRHLDRSERALEIDVEALAEEADRIEEAAYAELLTDPTAAQLRSVDRFLKLVERASLLKLDGAQTGRLNAGMRQFPSRHLIAWLNRELMEAGAQQYWIGYDRSADRALRQVQKFYQLAVSRDEAFVRHLDEALTRSGDTAAFLIAGGYHSSNVIRLLRERGYAYSVLTPVTDQETDWDLYEKNLLLQDTTEDPALKRAGTPRLKLSGPAGGIRQPFAARTLGARMARDPRPVYRDLIPYVSDLTGGTITGAAARNAASGARMASSPEDFLDHIGRYVRVTYWEHAESEEGQESLFPEKVQEVILVKDLEEKPLWKGMRRVGVMTVNGRALDFVVGAPAEELPSKLDPSEPGILGLAAIEPWNETHKWPRLHRDAVDRAVEMTLWKYDEVRPKRLERAVRGFLSGSMSLRRSVMEAFAALLEESEDNPLPAEFHYNPSQPYLTGFDHNERRIALHLARRQITLAYVSARYGLGPASRVVIGNYLPAGQGAKRTGYGEVQQQLIWSITAERSRPIDPASDGVIETDAEIIRRDADDAIHELEALWELSDPFGARMAGSPEREEVGAGFPRLLVLDDRQIHHRRVSDAYGSDHQIDHVFTVHEAIRMIRQADRDGRPYRLVISDLDLAPKIWGKFAREKINEPELRAASFRRSAGLLFVKWLMARKSPAGSPVTKVILNSTVFEKSGLDAWLARLTGSSPGRIRRLAEKFRQERVLLSPEGSVPDLIVQPKSVTFTRRAPKQVREHPDPVDAADREVWEQILDTAEALNTSPESDPERPGRVRMVVLTQGDDDDGQWKMVSGIEAFHAPGLNHWQMAKRAMESDPDPESARDGSYLAASLYYLPSVRIRGASGEWEDKPVLMMDAISAAPNRSDIYWTDRSRAAGQLKRFLILAAERIRERTGLAVLFNPVLLEDEPDYRVMIRALRARIAEKGGMYAERPVIFPWSRGAGADRASASLIPIDAAVLMDPDQVGSRGGDAGASTESGARMAGTTIDDFIAYVMERWLPRVLMLRSGQSRDMTLRNAIRTFWDRFVQMNIRTWEGLDAALDLLTESTFRTSSFLKVEDDRPHPIYRDIRARLRSAIRSAAAKTIQDGNAQAPVIRVAIVGPGFMQEPIEIRMIFDRLVEEMQLPEGSEKPQIKITVIDRPGSVDGEFGEIMERAIRENTILYDPADLQALRSHGLLGPGNASSEEDYFENTPDGYRLKPEVHREFDLAFVDLADASDLAALGKLAGTQDLVLANNSLTYLSPGQRVAAFERLTGLLDSGGSMIVTESNRERHEFLSGLREQDERLWKALEFLFTSRSESYGYVYSPSTIERSSEDTPVGQGARMAVEPEPEDDWGWDISTPDEGFRSYFGAQSEAVLDLAGSAAGVSGEDLTVRSWSMQPVAAFNLFGRDSLAGGAEAPHWVRYTNRVLLTLDGPGGQRISTTVYLKYIGDPYGVPISGPVKAGGMRHQILSFDREHDHMVLAYESGLAAPALLADGRLVMLESAGRDIGDQLAKMGHADADRDAYLRLASVTAGALGSLHAIHRQSPYQGEFEYLLHQDLMWMNGGEPVGIKDHIRYTGDGRVDFIDFGSSSFRPDRARQIERDQMRLILTGLLPPAVRKEAEEAFDRAYQESFSRLRRVPGDFDHLEQGARMAVPQKLSEALGGYFEAYRGATLGPEKLLELIRGANPELYALLDAAGDPGSMIAIWLGQLDLASAFQSFTPEAIRTIAYLRSLGYFEGRDDDPDGHSHELGRWMFDEPFDPKVQFTFLRLTNKDQSVFYLLAIRRDPEDASAADFVVYRRFKSGSMSVGRIRGVYGQEDVRPIGDVPEEVLAAARVVQKTVRQLTDEPRQSWGRGINGHSTIVYSLNSKKIQDRDPDALDLTIEVNRDRPTTITGGGISANVLIRSVEPPAGGDPTSVEASRLFFQRHFYNEHFRYEGRMPEVLRMAHERGWLGGRVLELGGGSSPASHEFLITMPGADDVRVLSMDIGARQEVVDLREGLLAVRADVRDPVLSEEQQKAIREFMGLKDPEGIGTEGIWHSFDNVVAASLMNYVDPRTVLSGIRERSAPGTTVIIQNDARQGDKFYFDRNGVKSNADLVNAVRDSGMEVLGIWGETGEINFDPDIILLRERLFRELTLEQAVEDEQDLYFVLRVPEGSGQETAGARMTEGLSAADDREPLRFIQADKILVYQARISNVGQDFINLYPLVVGLRRRYPSADIRVMMARPDTLSGIVPGVSVYRADGPETGYANPYDRTAAQASDLGSFINSADLIISVGARADRDFRAKASTVWIHIPQIANSVTVGVPDEVAGFEKPWPEYRRGEDKRGYVPVDGFEKFYTSEDGGRFRVGQNMTHVWERVLHTYEKLGLTVQDPWVPEAAALTSAERAPLLAQIDAATHASGDPNETAALDLLRRTEQNDGSAGHPVIINTMGKTQFPTYTEDQWAELIVRLNQASPTSPLYFLGFNPDRDRVIRQKAIRLYETKRAPGSIDLPLGSLPMRHGSAVRSWLLLFRTLKGGIITIDTGFGHIASVYKMRMVVVRGPSALDQWVPDFDHVRTLERDFDADKTLSWLTRVELDEDRETKKNRALRQAVLDDFKNYAGDIYAPFFLDDVPSLFDLARIFPKAGFVVSDAFVPDDARWVKEMPDPNNIHSVREFLIGHFAKLMKNHGLESLRVDVIDPAAKVLEVEMVLGNDAWGTPPPRRTLKFRYHVGKFEELDLHAGVLYLRRPGRAGRLLTDRVTAREIYRRAQQLLDAPGYLIINNHDVSYDLPGQKSAVIRPDGRRIFDSLDFFAGAVGGKWENHNPVVDRHHVRIYRKIADVEKIVPTSASLDYDDSGSSAARMAQDAGADALSARGPLVGEAGVRILDGSERIPRILRAGSKLEMDLARIRHDASRAPARWNDVAIDAGTARPLPYANPYLKTAYQTLFSVHGGHSVLYLAVSGSDEIIGYAQWGPEDDGQSATLEALYVVPEMAGTGVGRLLMDQVIRGARSVGVKVLNWRTSATGYLFYTHYLAERVPYIFETSNFRAVLDAGETPADLAQRHPGVVEAQKAHLQEVMSGASALPDLGTGTPQLTGPMLAFDYRDHLAPAGDLHTSAARMAGESLIRLKYQDSVSDPALIGRVLGGIRVFKGLKPVLDTGSPDVAEGRQALRALFVERFGPDLAAPMSPYERELLEFFSARPEIPVHFHADLFGSRDLGAFSYQDADGRRWNDPGMGVYDPGNERVSFVEASQHASVRTPEESYRMMLHEMSHVYDGISEIARINQQIDSGALDEQDVFAPYTGYLGPVRGFQGGPAILHRLSYREFKANLWSMDGDADKAYARTLETYPNLMEQTIQPLLDLDPAWPRDEIYLIFKRLSEDPMSDRHLYVERKEDRALLWAAAVQARRQLGRPELIRPSESDAADTTEGSFPEIFEKDTSAARMAVDPAVLQRAVDWVWHPDQDERFGRFRELVMEYSDLPGMGRYLSRFDPLGPEVGQEGFIEGAVGELVAADRLVQENPGSVLVDINYITDVSTAGSREVDAVLWADRATGGGLKPGVNFVEVKTSKQPHPKTIQKALGQVSREILRTYQFRAQGLITSYLVAVFIPSDQATSSEIRELARQDDMHIIDIWQGGGPLFASADGSGAVRPTPEMVRDWGLRASDSDGESVRDRIRELIISRNPDLFGLLQRAINLRDFLGRVRDIQPNFTGGVHYRTLLSGVSELDEERQDFPIRWKRWASEMMTSAYIRVANEKMTILRSAPSDSESKRAAEKTLTEIAERLARTRMAFHMKIVAEIRDVIQKHPAPKQVPPAVKTDAQQLRESSPPDEDHPKQWEQAIAYARHARGRGDLEKALRLLDKAKSLLFTKYDTAKDRKKGLREIESARRDIFEKNEDAPADSSSGGPAGSAARMADPNTSSDDRSSAETRPGIPVIVDLMGGHQPASTRMERVGDRKVAAGQGPARTSTAIALEMIDRAAPGKIGSDSSVLLVGGTLGELVEVRKRYPQSRVTVLNTDRSELEAIVRSYGSDAGRPAGSIPELYLADASHWSSRPISRGGEFDLVYAGGLDPTAFASNMGAVGTIQNMIAAELEWARDGGIIYHPADGFWESWVDAGIARPAIAGEAAQPVMSGIMIKTYSGARLPLRETIERPAYQAFDPAAMTALVAAAASARRHGMSGSAPVLLPRVEGARMAYTVVPPDAVVTTDAVPATSVAAAKPAQRPADQPVDIASRAQERFNVILKNLRDAGLMPAENIPAQGIAAARVEAVVTLVAKDLSVTDAARWREAVIEQLKAERTRLELLGIRLAVDARTSDPDLAERLGPEYQPDPALEGRRIHVRTPDAGGSRETLNFYMEPAGYKDGVFHAAPLAETVLVAAAAVRSGIGRSLWGDGVLDRILPVWQILVGAEASLRSATAYTVLIGIAEPSTNAAYASKSWSIGRRLADLIEVLRLGARMAAMAA